MKILTQILAMIMLALFGATVSADDAAIKKTINSFIPDSKVESIKPSEIPGLYEVSVGASIYYVSDDGKYLMQGQMIDAVAKKNITESKLSDVRKHALDRVGVDKMIVFKPENSKHQVSVFTDIDCGYCRKLHSEMDQYMEQGITVRYLFFPRAGKGSDSYKKAISVWCASDKQKALTAAKKGETLEAKNCENPINEHMQLGEDFGMNGTPMIITEKGNLLPGYVPAKQLATILNKE
ncbi:bifunctional protein-disulfide isomerase/oxidoreductase DsbC [Methylomonas sp. AM2-LC]|uniref:bifunctional protein-disulfide isomerase/oxidoreductase DsbC n=1 Tax=Methylomonas sp. AM2-LC TaxID=3153301 RepID=UPI003263CEBE